MAAFGILPHLNLQTILFFILQMYIITTVVRGVMALQQWIYWRSWRVRSDLVILGHAIALFAFSAMTEFVDSGAPPLTGFAAVLHAMSVLWPIQLAILAVDLGIRALRARQEAD